VSIATLSDGLPEHSRIDGLKSGKVRAEEISIARRIEIEGKATRARWSK
jgi:hypothetical protein